MLSEVFCWAHLSSCKPRAQSQAKPHNGGTQDYSCRKCVILQGCLPVVWIFVPKPRFVGQWFPTLQEGGRWGPPSVLGLRALRGSKGFHCPKPLCRGDVSHTEPLTWHRWFWNRESLSACASLTSCHLQSQGWASQGSGAVWIHTCPLGSVLASPFPGQSSDRGWGWTFNLY